MNVVIVLIHSNLRSSHHRFDNLKQFISNVVAHVSTDSRHRFEQDISQIIIEKSQIARS